MKSFIHTQNISTIHRWSLGMNEEFYPILYWACGCLSMLNLKLIHVNKRPLNLIHNCEKYPLSPPKPRCLALIEQYISGSVYSVQRSFLWHSLTDVNPHLIPPALPMISKYDLLWRHRYMSRQLAIVTSQWPIIPPLVLWTLSYRNGVEVSDLSSLLITRLCPVFQFSLWKESAESWIVRQVMSWLTGQGQCARHDTTILQRRKSWELYTVLWALN